MEFLFVYGTLMQRVSNKMSAFLKLHSTFSSDGYFHGKLYDLGEYPGAIISTNREEKVFGQVFELHQTEEVFPVLDAYEGVEEGLYLRRKVEVTTVAGQIIHAWVYVYNQPVELHKFIESGDYMKYLNGG